MKQFLALLAILAFVAPATTQDTVPLPVAEVIRNDPAVAPFQVKKAIVNVGKFVEVDGVLLLDETASPELANVGVLQLAGTFDSASVIAEDAQRNQVPAKKVTDREWLLLGSGQIFVYATMATKEPFAITTQRYNVCVPSLRPDPPNPDKPVDPDKPVPTPTVPEDRFDNLGQRIAALAASLPLKKEVAANYRQFAEQLRGSIEVAEMSRAMVDKRDAILKDVRSEWSQVLTVILNDFTARRPDMVRADVVEHWLAIANGLDPK